MRLIAILPALLCAVALAISGLLPVEAPVPIEPAEAVMTYRIMEERTMPQEEPQEPEPMIFEATAFCYTGNRTATGTWPMVGTVATDPEVIPLGTRLWVEGYGVAVAADTGGLIKGNIIDVYLPTETECWQWGRRQVEVRILE